MTPERYVEIEDKMYAAIEKLRKSTKDAERRARLCNPPKDYRPATPNDIRKYNVLWYLEVPCWHVVCEVLCPDDRWKAYVSEDGCRYGLEGASIALEY